MTERSMADIVRDQQPLVMSPATTVKEACERMRDLRVGAVLVADPDRRLLGIFTGRDAVTRVLAEGRNGVTTRLAEVMTSNPAKMPTGGTAIEALRLMQDCCCRHVPIVDEGKVLGIVSRGDFRGLEQARLDEESGLWERI